MRISLLGMDVFFCESTHLNIDLLKFQHDMDEIDFKAFLEDVLADI